MTHNENDEYEVSQEEFSEEEDNEPILPVKKVKEKPVKIERKKQIPDEEVEVVKKPAKPKGRPQGKQEGFLPKKVRTVSSYRLFYSEEQAKLKEENPKLKIGEISSQIAKKWKEVGDEEKAEYKERAIDENETRIRAFEKTGRAIKKLPPKEEKKAPPDVGVKGGHPLKKKKKQIIIEETDSESSEDEVIVVKKKRKTAVVKPKPKQVAEPPPPTEPTPPPKPTPPPAPIPKQRFFFH